MLTPSSVTFCDCDRTPLKLSPTTPACRATSDPASRFCSGRSCTRCSETTLLTEVLTVSSGLLEDSTVTLSAAAPTSSFRSTVMRALTSSCTCCATALRNPGDSADTEYSPGCRDGKM